MIQNENLYQDDGILNLKNQSCEMISDALYIEIANRYPDRDIWIEVSEDGENGSIVQYNTTQPGHSVVI